MSLKSKIACLVALFSIAATLIYTAPAGAQNKKQPFLPVTFSQEGWSNSPDFVYSRWYSAFYNFKFYGFTRRNWLYIGCRRVLAVEGSKAGLTALLDFLPQTGPSHALNISTEIMVPTSLPDSGALAGEVVALTMNVAYNDKRLMPRYAGCDLELFKLRGGPYRGKTVGQALDIANRILGGDPPTRYGLANYQAITDIVRAINLNYEFIDFNIFIDRGYLIPNRTLGLVGPPHDPQVP